MKYEKTGIPEVICFLPTVISDDRGFFVETYRLDIYAGVGVVGAFVQDNHSGSLKGILRGLHYQIHHPQGKLVSTVAGEVFDVAVDLRRSSPTLGHWVGMLLSAKNRKQLWIPPGFAHGFYVLSEWAEVSYKNTDYYYPEWERCLLWNDSTLGIEWPLLKGRPPVLSKKDSQGLVLSEAELFD